MNLYGNFAKDGLSFFQTNPRPPRPWNSYLWNERFVASCSHVGQGSALEQDARGRRRDLHEGRMLWLVDTGTRDAWTANALPLPPRGEPYRCEHAFGVATIDRTHAGIASSLAITVPREFGGELWRLRLRNTGRRRRRLRVIPFLDTPVSVWFPGAVSGRYRPALRAAVVSDVVRTGTHYAHYTDGSRCNAFLAMDRQPDGFDTRRSAFVGPYGNTQAPVAITELAGCTGSVSDYERVILALQTTVTLAPGAETEIRILAGFHGDEAELRAATKRYFAPGHDEFAAVRAAAAARVGSWQVRTPQPDVDRFLNGFLQHQLRFNATWARVYYNGIRDLAQDTAALAAQDPAFAWTKFRQVLSFQYASGYAPRAWIGGGVVEQDYADSPVWLAQTAHTIVMETGNRALLDETVPFHDGPPASVYEHLRRSVRYLWNDRGRHGLSKIHKGDWNDLLNAAGWHGRGESVWLSQALCVSLADFAALADIAGQPQDAAWARRCRAAIAAAIQRHGYEPKASVYRRGFTDTGESFGHDGSPEGVDLIAQAWAVLAGIADARVMTQVDRRLETPLGTKTMERGFDQYRAEIGFVSANCPGCNVNAGYYQHAAAFAVVADAVAGRGDAAWRRLRKLLPFVTERQFITGEPYVVNNAYHGPASGYRHGQSDTGWITGTAGWIARAVTQHIFGLEPTLAGLVVRPCLPPTWKRAAITRRFRGATYHVEYRPDQRGITVNGEPHRQETLPHQAGAEYQVVVGGPRVVH